jgi:hypothetical protein
VLVVEEEVEMILLEMKLVLAAVVVDLHIKHLLPLLQEKVLQL